MYYANQVRKVCLFSWMRRNLLPQLSPPVLGDACGHLGCSRQHVGRRSGFPVSPAAGSLQTTCSAAPADLALTGALSSPVQGGLSQRETLLWSEAAGGLGSAGMLLCVTTYTSWCLGLKSDFAFPELLLQYCSRHWVKHTDNTMGHLFK